MRFHGYCSVVFLKERKSIKPRTRSKPETYLLREDGHGEGKATVEKRTGMDQMIDKLGRTSVWWGMLVQVCIGCL